VPGTGRNYMRSGLKGHIVDKKSRAKPPWFLFFRVGASGCEDNGQKQWQDRRTMRYPIMSSVNDHGFM
jgi:hypothetical protein